jgi:hypothetical protein
MLTDEQKRIADGIAKAIGLRTTWREDKHLDGVVFHTQLHVNFAVALDTLEYEGETAANEIRYRVRKGFQDLLERED